MASLEAEIERRMKPYEKQTADPKTIPGVVCTISWLLIVELGADMSVFPEADHCASRAGSGPGSCESPCKQIRVHGLPIWRKV